MCDVAYPAAAFGVLTISVAVPAAGAEITAGETSANEPSSSVNSDGNSAGLGISDEQPPNKLNATQIAPHRANGFPIMDLLSRPDRALFSVHQ